MKWLHRHRLSILFVLNLMRLLLILLLSSRAYAAKDLSAWALALQPHRECTVEGYYSVPGSTKSQSCPDLELCPPGSYCTGGEQKPCPAGVYGDVEALHTKECSAPCPEGYFCPLGTAIPIKCGAADVYCPLSSTHPLPVPKGFYALGGTPSTRRSIHPCNPGSFCVAGKSQKCPSRTYGATAKLSSSKCTGLCPVGHYCPTASIQPIPCRSGTYGDTPGLSDESCSNLCPPGYACPEGTASATTWPCPHDTFCPLGSSKPQAPHLGFHVVRKTVTEEVACPKGSYCSPVEAPGVSKLCPGGTFGNVTGLTTSACSGLCEAGYFCPRGSTNATQHPCGNVDVFCPPGSTTPTLVSRGSYTIGRSHLNSLARDSEAAINRVTRITERRCEPGHYCVNGERFACPAGTFGDKFGLLTSECSGKCAAGYYCPEKSIVAEAVACTTSTAFCPPASALPSITMKGYCAISEESGRWYAQRKAKPGEFAWRGMCYPCPAGTFGSEQMEIRQTCSGSCAAGYYCPLGSTSRFQHECGSASVYCPVASKSPWQVLAGFYTSIDIRAIIPNKTQAPGCEPGLYRDYTTSVNAFLDVVTGRSPLVVDYGDYSYPVARCVPCPEGTFKTQTGDDVSLCTSCPEYTTVSSDDRRTCLCFRRAGGQQFDVSNFALYFDKTMLTCELVPKALLTTLADGNDEINSIYTRSEQFPCERGYFCKDGVRTPCPAGFYGDGLLETRPTCSGICSPGYYCPLGSWNSTAHACGDVNVFCPRGSAIPTPVWPGHYSVTRSTVTNSEGQQECKPGSFCIDSKSYLCPAGRYGDKTAETSPLCSGLCARGYYCLEGSTSPMQLKCGSDEYICRTGSSKPQLVFPGYYSIGITNSTRFIQRPCEPGYFCMHGIKYQCPAGTYGATSGLSTAACSGKCSPGYYCPSFPGLPSTSKTQNECGNSFTYCPEGTGNEPKVVESGQYSISTSGISDDGRNATQDDVKICPKGFYCRQGIRIRCPEGTFGNLEGLSSPICCGWCPAGFFCPYATIDYRTNPCIPGTYSSKGSTTCIQCPIFLQKNVSELEKLRFLSQNPQPCTTHRECCNDVSYRLNLE